MMNKQINFKSMYRTALVALCLITVGAGQMWGDEITVYVTGEIFTGTGDDAWDNSTSTIKVDIRKGYPECFECDNNSFNGVKNVDMTNTGYTYNGYPIYSYTLNQAGAQWRFKHYKNGDWKEDYTTEWHSTTGQIYRGYWSGVHHWVTYGRDVTIYGIPQTMDGSKWIEGTHSLYANFKYGSQDGEWKKQLMTKTAYTYSGNPIYKCTMLIPYNVVKKVQFLYNDGEDHELYAYTPSPDLTTTNIDGKIFRGYISGSHTWATYGRDVTVYTIPDYLFKDKGTPYNESSHYPAVCVQYGSGVGEWKTTNMSKTAYTYDSYPIYTATFLLDYNIFKEYQIKYFNKSGDSQVDLYQFNEGGGTEYAPSYIDDKLYHGWNGSSHDFFDYTYDVTLDLQEGGAGTTTIKVTDGAAMPAATMPGRDGYAFGGYYTETSGSGTQYYDAEGASARNWDSRTITTLYAKWTARNYTITLEDMVPTTAGQGSVTVTFDASTNMTSAVTKPTKTNYTFDGYWTDNDNEGATLVTQLIDANGYWKKDISTYTGHDGSDNPTWIYPNDKSLFAKWNEDLHDVTISVSPAGAGSVQISGEDITSLTNIGYATHSAEMTAVPTNALWVFKEWRVSDDTKLHLDLVNYSTTGTTMKVTATGDAQTLTAVFVKRYELVGSVWDGSETGGMPGWEYDGTGDFNINSFTAVDTDNGVDLSYSCSLTSNTAYKLRINDRGASKVYGKSDPSTSDYYTLPANTSAELSEYGEGSHDVWIQTGDASGLFTFRITKMRDAGSGNMYYPTISVDRPQQVNFGWKYINIGGSLTSGDVGGTVAVAKKSDASAVSTGSWLPYGTVVTYTATPTPGYTVNWFSKSDYSGDSFSSSYSYDHDGTSIGNGYAKFIENSTSVTLSNDGNGKVQIGGADATSTTCGVTTTRELTAVPDAGYKFSSWDKSGDDITLSSTSTNPTTLTGLGSGLDEGQTVTANFVERYSIKGTMNGENWGTPHTLSNIGTNASSKDTCYVTMTLPANTTYEFAIYDEQTGGWYKAGTDAVYDMTYTNHTNWEFGDTKTYNCGITTAGKGTYKFIFNITDKTVTVVYPTSYQVNYGASPSEGGSITVVDGDENAVPNGGYVVAGGSVTYTAAAASGYTFVGWCHDDSYGDTFNTDDSWTDGTLAATSNSYAKFKSTNFVIYRTGDMEDDPRAAYDDVESFTEGEGSTFTISEKIEFRMKVSHLNQWYSLSLPFTVNAVKVWDEVDGEYYDLVPYYRSGGTFYTGHYVIRTPELTNDSLALANFSAWNDPENYDGYLPSMNTPYIVQWHDYYFQDRYISFFGAAGQSIPTAMTVKDAPKTKSWVTVYGNNAMVEGTVVDAYTLNGDEIWERPVDKGKSVTIQPFECYIRANSEVTNKYLVLRRGMTFEDEATHFETIDVASPVNAKVLIDGQIYILREGKMYTLQGILVQ